MGKVSTSLTQHNWRTSFPSSLPHSLSLSDALAFPWPLLPTFTGVVAPAWVLVVQGLLTYEGEQEGKEPWRMQGTWQCLPIHTPAGANGSRSDSGSSEVHANICVDFSGFGSAPVYTDESRGFSHKRTKSCFPFIERKEAPIPPSLLCSWDSPSWCCCASWLVVLADP